MKKLTEREKLRHLTHEELIALHGTLCRTEIMYDHSDQSPFKVELAACEEEILNRMDVREG